jgi:hypothetical protein
MNGGEVLPSRQVVVLAFVSQMGLTSEGISRNGPCVERWIVERAKGLAKGRTKSRERWKRRIRCTVKLAALIIMLCSHYFTPEPAEDRYVTTYHHEISFTSSFIHRLCTLSTGNAW